MTFVPMTTLEQGDSMMLVDAAPPGASLDRYAHDIRLPVELWFEILSYATISTIETVSLSCSTLRWLAQPLLFKTFAVRLYGPTPHSPLTPRDSSRNTMTRLAVLGYPHITNAMTELRITTPSLAASPARAQHPIPAPPATIMIDTIFAAFPNLVNLRRLVCHDIIFTQDHLSALRHLPQLRDLELQSCATTCDPDQFPDFSLMPLETLIFDYPYSSLDFFRNYRFLALFLQSRKLKHIYAGPANDILFAITQTPPPETLSILEIPVSCASSPVFVSALACCPSVRDISLYMAIGNNRLPPLDYLPSEILPNLRSYHGPRTYAHHFIHGRDVTHVEFALPCQPDDLCETIKGFDADIESLSCKINSLNAPLLKTIHTNFPSLKHLAISGVSVDIDSLSSVLAIAKAHRGLTSIQITIQTGEPRLTNSWRTTMAKMFLDLLNRAYPALQTAKLVYQPQVSVVWNRPPTKRGQKRPITVDASEFWIEKLDNLLPTTHAVWDTSKQ